MPNASLFTRLPEVSQPSVTIYFDGQAISACTGDSVAAALLAAGYHSTRKTPVSGAARGPFCMMGVCFECLVEINGEPNRQACLAQVQDGMQVRTMMGARTAHRLPP